jgi:hypothetical protein
MKFMLPKISLIVFRELSYRLLKIFTSKYITLLCNIIVVVSVFFMSQFVFMVSSAKAAFDFSILQIIPAEINSKEQEVSVKIVVNSLPTGDSYFRASISSGSSYIGYVKNNDANWIKTGTLSSDKLDSRCTNYFKISGDGEYLLSLKIGDDNEISNGIYVVKAHRFTSTCGSYIESGEESSQVLNIILPTPPPTPTPPAAPTFAPESKSTYVINNARDNSGNNLSSVKIYIDGNYTGNYAPETYTFCDGCKCGTNKVNCSFGEHSFKLERSGYEDWNDVETINSGGSYSRDPVLNKIETSSETATPTPAPTALPTPTPTPKPTKSPTPSSSATLEGSSEPSVAVLGLQDQSANNDPSSSSAETGQGQKFPIASVLLIGFGLIFFGIAGYAYFVSKNTGYNNSNGATTEEDKD